MSEGHAARVRDDDRRLGPRRATLFAVLAALAAAGYLLAFRAGRDAPRASFVVAVLGIAAVFNLLWLLRRHGLSTLAPGSRRELLAAVALAGLSGAGNLCVARAVMSLGTGPTATLTQTEIFFVAIAAWLALREPLGPALLFGCVLGAAGVTLGQLPAAAGAPWSTAGVAWALGAALCFALIVVIGRAVAATVDIARVNAARLVLAASLVLLVPGALAQLGDLGAAAWGWAALAAIAGPVASRLLQLHALAELEAARVKLWALTTAIWAFLLEALCFGHAPSQRDLAGAALILAGVALPVLAQRSRRFVGARRQSR